METSVALVPSTKSQRDGDGNNHRHDEVTLAFTDRKHFRSDPQIMIDTARGVRDCDQMISSSSDCGKNKTSLETQSREALTCFLLHTHTQTHTPAVLHINLYL